SVAAFGCRGNRRGAPHISIMLRPESAARASAVRTWSLCAKTHDARVPAPLLLCSLSGRIGVYALDPPAQLRVFELVRVGKTLVLQTADLALVALPLQGEQRSLNGVQPAARKVQAGFRRRTMQIERAHDASHRQALQEERRADDAERHRLERAATRKWRAICQRERQTQGKRQRDRATQSTPEQ